MSRFIAGPNAILSEITFDSDFKTFIDELANGGWLVTWLVQEDDETSSVHVKRFDAEGVAIGVEQTLGTMSGPIVTTLADGGWLVGEAGWSSDPASREMWRFDADGERVLPAIELDDRLVEVKGLPSGGWVSVSLRESSDNEWELVQQLHDADGQPVGASATMSDVYFWGVESDVTALDDGGWVLTWGYGTAWYHQQYASDGTSVGTTKEMVSPFSVYAPRVTALEDGGWLSIYTQHPTSYLQRYDSEGEKVGDATVVADDYRNPFDIAALAGGGWAIAYGDVIDFSNNVYGTFVQVFGDDGTTVGRPYQVVDHWGHNTEIEALDDGGFVVKWDRGDNVHSTVRQRIYRPDEEGNARPVAVDDFETIGEGSRGVIDVLENDRDADKGDVLTVESATMVKGNATVYVTEHGDLRIKDMNQQLFTGQSTKLIIEYTITDGFETDTARVTIKVKGRNNEGDVLRGTNGADRFDGNGAGEVFFGRGGNDYIDGKGGDDFLLGDGGRDIINAGDGRDTIVGGKGDDKLFGGTGSDTFIFSPGDGHDVITQPSEWSAGVRDILDFTSYGFKSVDQVKRLIEHEGNTTIIDLPGKDRIEIIDTLGHGMYFTI